jgi:predicted aspartyl protease
MRALRVLVVVVGGFASFPQAAGVESEGVTRFERGTGAVVLPVQLNGRGPFRFLLDTGSTRSSVSARTAEAIRAPVVARTVMGSAAGSREVPVARVDTLDVGPVTVRDLLASVVELDGLVDVDGVIGQDVLAALRFTIDFTRGQVLWAPKVRGCDGAKVRGCDRSVLELQWSHGRFVVALPQRQSVLRLVPDTGADSLVLFDPVHGLPVTHLPRFATLTTLSGETEVRLARVRELHVGSLMLRDVPAVVAARDGSEPAEVDGLLPLHFFDRVTFDGPKGLMMFF